eukprot:gb/GEZN01008888.1/.p1 GENE.gb/GEZN01008888.1/~~gb/GEZN01008888.1/.p1  ORF type:complete len:316 (-),score=18.32 gb/GEZN01008888.1/:160-1107(-)
MLLLHLSGTHGVEGHAGSAIQAAFLHNWTHLLNMQRPELPSVVLVHALNPFGFHYGRRWNEDSVDLNRNCLSPDDFADVLKRDPNFASYQDFDSLLNPTEITWYDPLAFLYQSAMNIWTHGYTACKRATVTGQYHKPTGLFYGGRSLATSHRLLHSWLEEQGYTKSLKSGITIDVHTGLGPEGMDTMIMGSAKDKSQALSHWDHISYAIEGVDSDGPAGSGAYDKTVGFNKQCLTALFPKDSMLVATQEFGTIPGVQVLYGLRCEGTVYHHMSTTKGYFSGLVRSAFYVRKASWKVSVVQRGVYAAVAGFLGTSH